MKRIAFAALLAMAATSAAAQGGLVLQGVADVEAWKTDTMSTLLRRNDGDPGALYRLRLWSAAEPVRGLFIFAHGVAEGGPARQFDGPGTTVMLEQGGIRLARHRGFVVDAGRMVHPVGGFGSRALSTRNPLIGIPDSYSPVYPLGVMISSELARMDFRAAAVTLPMTRRGYVPGPSPSLRPVIGVGVTPITGLRLGASATYGAYLNRELTASELDGVEWDAYGQQVIAAELQYGFGHFDLRAEFAAAKFDVPYNGWISGKAGYLEARATLTPRVFVATRAEVNNYPFIRPTSGTGWISRETEFRDIEVGVGFRFTENRLLKASYRRDDWVVTPQNSGFVRPGGGAVALQLSQSFDVADWVSRFR